MAGPTAVDDYIASLSGHLSGNSSLLNISELARFGPID
jgi:hypothetical protein